MPSQFQTVGLTCLVTIPLTALVTWALVRPPAPAIPAAPPTPEAPAAPPTPEASLPDGAPEAVARPVERPAAGRTPAPWAEKVSRVATTDLDGDGRDEVALAGTDLRVTDGEGALLARHDAEGGCQVLTAGDGAVWTAWGWSRETPDAAGLVVRYTLPPRPGPAASLVRTEVARPPIPRVRFVSLVPRPDHALLAWYLDSFQVGAFGVTAAGGWRDLQPRTTQRTATSWALADLDGDGVEDLAYGRVYGDAPGSHGDAWLLRAGDVRVPIETERGVRALATGDTDGDGRPELLLADGWHKNYGKLARAQVRIAAWTGDRMESTLLDRIPGETDVTRLLVGDVDGDGRDEVLAVTGRVLRLLDRDGDAWTSATVATGVVDAALIRTNAAARPRVLVVGTEPVLLDLGS